MFRGTYRYRIDAKGRLPVPSPFRRALREDGPRLVVTALDRCLAAYPPAVWSRLEAKLQRAPALGMNVKALVRLLASRGADCELDAQGRILLPSALRHAAGLAREAVVVGVLDRIEVWSPEAWDAFLRASERLLDDVSFEVGLRPQGKSSR